MTRRDALKCVHEPFGDAFYFGPEFMSKRFADDAAYREESASSQKTYADIVQDIAEEGQKEVCFLLFGRSCDTGFDCGLK
jgi:hypothetical protein